MESRSLSKEAQDVIKAYENVPYYNNKRREMRMGLRALVGKGSPQDIEYESTLYALKERVDLKTCSPETKKKFLIDHNLGIDCSGLAFYILDAESRARGKGSLQSHLSFPYANGVLSRIGRFLRRRYVENAGVRTFAHDSNSHEVPLLDMAPGDIITMLESGVSGQTNHIVVIEQVDRVDTVPTEIHYVHSIAWPIDGKLGHGVREGKIVIKNINQGLLEQTWIENGQTGTENFTLHRANLAKLLSIRRLNWL